MPNHELDPLRYRLLTGPDDRSFCEKVSQALVDGFRLYGSPSVTQAREPIGPWW